MSTSIIDAEEELQSKIPALALLTTLGYSYLSPQQCKQLRTDHSITSTKAQKETSAVILKPILREYLTAQTVTVRGKKHQLSAKSIDKIIKALTPPMNEGLKTTNENIYNHLIHGITVNEIINGKKNNITIQLIDWENPSNNHFQCTEELRVLKAQGSSVLIPDIVCYVNGLPWVVIEAKRPTSNKAGESTLKKAVSQQLEYQTDKAIPHLFAYSQMLLAINGNSGLYATCKTPKKFWANWKEEHFTEQYFSQLKNKKLSKQQLSDIIDHRQANIKDRYLALLAASKLAGGELTVTDQDRLIISLLSPERLLEMTRFYTTFDKKIGKIIARYQQVFGAKALIERVTQFEPQQSDNPEHRPGARKGGVIWHTTGSGKSLTMVFLTKALVWIKALAKCRVIVVTDRVDLETQLSNTFASTGLLSANKDRQQALSKSGEKLAYKIGKDNQRIIFTIINKFGSAVKYPECFNPSENILVLIDEGHRSQGGENSAHMFRSLPKAAFVAFTGTPLLKNDQTEHKFGSIIHSYTMQKAVEDKAVTPLLYEERIAKLDLDEKAVDEWFETSTAPLTDKQKSDLKRKFSQKDPIYQTEGRIELIAHDISNHFAKFKQKGLKGQIACATKATAIRYKNALDEIGLITSAVVISAPEKHEGKEDVDEESKDIIQKWWKTNITEVYQQSERTYTKTIVKQFETSAGPDVLIVVDKLLTGFDEPKNTVLYIDKSLKKHNLIQAIARVNRLHQDKPFGYLIDYRGILSELDMTIEKYQKLAERDQNGYDPEDLKELYKQMASEYKKLPKLYSDLWAVFAEVKNKQDQAALRLHLHPDMVAINGQPQDKNLKKRDEFYIALTAFVKCMKVALQSTTFFNDTSFDGPASQAGSREHYKQTLKTFVNLRQQVREDADETIDFDEYNDDIRLLIDTHIQGVEIAADNTQYHVSNLGQSNRVKDNANNTSERASERAGENQVAEPTVKQTTTEDTRAKAGFIASRLSKSIEDEFDDDPYAKEHFSKLLKKTIEEMNALFDDSQKHKYTAKELAVKKAEKLAELEELNEKSKKRQVDGISELFTNDKGEINTEAQRYFGIFKTHFAENPSVSDKIDQDKLVEHAFKTDEIVKAAKAKYSINVEDFKKAASKELLIMLIGDIELTQARQIIAKLIAGKDNDVTG